MTLAEAADVATALAAIIAAASLVFAGCSLRQQARSADLASLQGFLKSVEDAEARFSRSNNNERPATNYLNVLEVYAAAVNRRLLGKVSREIATERLVNDVAIFTVLAPEDIEKAITSDKTFAELIKFARRNRAKISEATQRERDRRATGTSI